MSASMLLTFLVPVMIFMFLSLYAVIASFKDEIREKNKVQGWEINEELGLNRMACNSLTAKKKKEILDRWYSQRL